MKANRHLLQTDMHEAQALLNDRRAARREGKPGRRRTERIRGPWLAEVRGRDASGRKFAESTVLEDVSASGMFVRLRKDVPLNSRLFVVFTFKVDASQDAAVPKVASIGQVCRIEKRAEAAVSGVGIHFRHHRFL